MARKPTNGKNQFLNSYFKGKKTRSTPFGSMPIGKKSTSNMPRQPRMPKSLQSKVKRANERLRKLETVNKLSGSSSAYQSIAKIALDKNSIDNPFYRFFTNKDGSTGIRFVLPKDYANMSRIQQKRYEDAVDRFLNNQTSTKLGIESAMKKSYDNFMDSHPDLNWTQEEYERFFKEYSQMVEDEEAKNAYDRMTQVFEEPGEFGEDLTDEKITRILNYNSSDFRYSNRPVVGEMSNTRLRQ